MALKRKIIVIYGGGSGSGKTSLAVNILKHLSGWAAIKISPTSMYSSVSVEESVPGSSQKDTFRLSEAGADPVIHVQIPSNEIKDGINKAISLVPAGRSLLMEGRGAITCLKPDLSILVWRPDLENLKGSLEELSVDADLVFVNAEKEKISSLRTDYEKRCQKAVIFGSLKGSMRGKPFIDLIEMLKGRDIL